MTASPLLPPWEHLLSAARSRTSARRIRRPGQSPSTAPVSTALLQFAPDQSPPFLLYRDTNSWCPFCERVWFALEEKQIPFDVEFIDLSNKPQWYLDLVPTALVPAAKIQGKLIYESKDILLALEEQFPEPALLPADPAERAIAHQWIEDSEISGFLTASYQFLRADAAEADALAALQATLEAHLDALESLLS